MFAYFSPFLTYSSKKRIAKNASIQQYYKELSSLICCDNKSKKKFLHDFIFQIDEFASEHDQETISYKMLSDRFGSPTEIANAFLAETNSLQLQNLIIHNSRRKKRILILLLIVFLFLILHQMYKIYQSSLTKHDYIIETAYPGGSAPALEELGGSDRTKNAAARRKSRRSHLQQLGRRGRHVPIRCHNLFFVSWADSLRRTDRNRPSGYHSSAACALGSAVSQLPPRGFLRSPPEPLPPPL